MLRSLALLLLLALSAGAARAGECPGDSPGCGFSRCATPATAPPSYLWNGGELRPAGEALPPGRDSTGFNEFTQPYSLAHPQWMGLDIRPPYLYALAAWGLQVWDLANPEDPRRVAQVDGPTGLRRWSDNPEVKQPLRWISIAGSTAAVVGAAGVGVSLFDLSAPAAPRLLYQDAGFSAETVAATEAGGRTLVVVPAVDGARLYDATAASPLFRCLEEGESCGPVRLPTFGRPSAVYAAALGPLVALSHGSTPGLEVYDLSDPLQPRLRLAAAAGETVGGVALFESQGSPVLAYRTETGLQLARPLEGGLESLAFIPLADGGALHYLTASTSSAGPVLYLGSDNRCSGGMQREFLFDVSDPRNPRDLTPSAVGGEGYWGWYYRGNPTGFNGVMPRTGRFNGDYFYRAAMSILDVHRRTPGGPALPRASFTFEPSSPRPGQAVTFRSTSTGAPEVVEWLAAGGAPAGGVGTPFTTRFGAPGPQEVSLTVCNGAGCDSATQTLWVDGGPPLLTAATASPNPATTGRPVTFQAVASGQEPLLYRWSLGGVTLTGATATWTPPAGSPSLLAVFLTVSGPGGVATANLALRILGPEGTFEDLPPGHPAAAAIGTAVRRGVMAPCAPRRFCPDQPAPRQEIAEVLGRLSRPRPPKRPRGLFADLPRTDPAAAWIEDLYLRRRIDPCGASPLRFCPGEPMLRAAVPAWFLRTLRGAAYQPPRPRGLFADLPPANPAAAWAEAAYGLHLIEPCGTAPLRFCPRSPLTRGDLARWLVTAFELR